MLIESGQAIFRGKSYYFPREVWNVKEQRFEPYTGNVPKEEGWGDIVSEAEAAEFQKPN